MLHRALVLCVALAAAACTLTPPQGPNAPAARIVRPVWSPDAVTALIEVSASGPAEGLASFEDAASELRDLQDLSTTSAAGAAAFDGAADALFVDLAHTFAQGALDPARADPQWRIGRAAVPDVSSLLAAARRNASAVRTLATLLPQSDEYAALRRELGRVRAEPPGALGPAGRVREERIASLRASLERWRWLPRDWPSRRIEVRVAQFQAILHQTAAAPRMHTAIVGARTRQTPSFAAEITAVTLNPTWTPPRSIVINELLPLFARDPGAASRGGYDAIDRSGAIVAPTSIDWASRPFPYQVRQRAGPLNALGRVKFEMPNPFGVYLHDTPNHALFEREARALSHGCVRVDDALDLAAAILAPVLPAPALQQEVDTGHTRSLPLAAPLPVYAFYITASSADGAVVYAEDIYRRDAALITALDAPTTEAQAAVFAPLVRACADAQ
jgi:murein L,D-transpeptidase YcbB/YkuD